MAISDLIGLILGAVLTLMVFSFLIKDNALFRLTLSIFIGVAAGYAVVLAFYTVLWPQLILPLLAGSQTERLLALPPLALAVLLLFKASTRLSRVGNPALAFLVGVGAAAAVGGAVLGTLFPQTAAAVNAFDLEAAGGAGGAPGRLAEAVLILIGALTTLIYFHFGARRPAAAGASGSPGVPAPAPEGQGEQPVQAGLAPAGGPPPQRPEWMESLAWIGELFIAVTFGVLFAGAFQASLAALIERVQSLVETVQVFLR